MDISREKKQRNEFCNILFTLAKSQELLQDAGERSAMYKRLEALYYSKDDEEKFRHFYSDIFSVLTQLQLDSTLGDMNILGQNLMMIRAGYQPQNKDDAGKLIDIRDNIRKLYDHVSLDMARIMYSDAADRKISGEESISELQSQVTQAKVEIENIRKEHVNVKKEQENTRKEQENIKREQENTEAKINSQQREYIAILGIFSAVVLTFVGGIAFSTSVLENIAQASVYRILIVTLIIGVVLVNSFFGMFYYVNALISKEKRIRPLWITNIVLLLLIVGVVVAWFLGTVEQRNEKIDNMSTSFYEKQVGF